MMKMKPSPEVTLLDVKNFASEIVSYADFMAIQQAEKDFERECRADGKTTVADMIEQKKLIWMVGIRMALREVK